jgi:hypothetical protein
MLIYNDDLKIRTELNFKRMRDKIYCYPQVFDHNSWPGDWEGRCLLSLCCMYKCFDKNRNKQKIIMKQIDGIIKHLDEYTNPEGYFGKSFDGKCVDEQQVSGNSWFIRGLLELYSITKDEKHLNRIKSILNNFYNPINKFYDSYPLCEREDGGVGGHTINQIVNGWKVSSDIGCAFISLDSLSKCYEYIQEPKLKKCIENIIDVFVKINYVDLKCQTHAALSCCRGILKFYRLIKENKYLEIATKVFDDYLNFGMTKDYANINWFGRKDTWSEPCCIVDSYMIAINLFKISNDNRYLIIANRIYLNAIRNAQRSNGGVGCNTCLTDTNSECKMYLYEAYFCCTMRFGEGLIYFRNNFFIEREKEFLITTINSLTYKNNKECIKIRGDIYNKKKMIINVNANKPVRIYLNNHIKIVSDDNDVIRDENFLILMNKHKKYVIKLDIPYYFENNEYFAGDMLLVKNNIKEYKNLYFINGQKYSYLINQIYLNGEKECNKFIETI